MNNDNELQSVQSGEEPELIDDENLNDVAGGTDPLDQLHRCPRRYPSAHHWVSYHSDFTYVYCRCKYCQAEAKWPVNYKSSLYGDAVPMTLIKPGR